MRARNSVIAGLCIMILATPFYITEHIKDITDKTDMSYMQLEEKVKVEEEDSAIIVYIAPTGECYHFKKTCAGKNAIETTLGKSEKRPCKKCVR